ncbi:MAG: hypothetical protein ACK59A_09340 [Cyanobacteriota bacterium]|jgi:hypothetical protein
MAQGRLDQLGIREDRHDFHGALTLGAYQGVYFPNPLEKHRPGFFMQGLGLGGLGFVGGVCTGPTTPLPDAASGFV